MIFNVLEHIFPPQKHCANLCTNSGMKNPLNMPNKICNFGYPNIEYPRYEAIDFSHIGISVGTIGQRPAI